MIACEEGAKSKLSTYAACREPATIAACSILANRKPLVTGSFISREPSSPYFLFGGCFACTCSECSRERGAAGAMRAGSFRCWRTPNGVGILRLRARDDSAGAKARGISGANAALKRRSSTITHSEARSSVMPKRRSSIRAEARSSTLRRALSRLIPVERKSKSPPCRKGATRAGHPLLLGSRLRDVDAVVGFYGDVVDGGGALQFVPGELSSFKGALQRLE